MLARSHDDDNVLIPYAELRDYFFPRRFDTYSSVVFYGSLLYNKVNVFSEWEAFHEVIPRLFLGRIPEHNVLPEKVRLVISVVTCSELAAVSFDVKALENKGIEHILVSMPDFTANVSNRAVMRAIRAIEKLDDGHAYVHCKAGRARSAMFVVIYMAHQALKKFPIVNDAILDNVINDAQQKLKDIRTQVDISDEKMLKAKEILRELQVPYISDDRFRFKSRGHFLCSLEFKNSLCQLASFKNLCIYMISLSEGAHRAQRLQAFMEEVYSAQNAEEAEKWYAALRMQRSPLDQFVNSRPQVTQDDKPVRDKLYKDFVQELDLFIHCKLPVAMFNAPLYTGDFVINRDARLPSFADTFVKLNHEYDSMLEYYYFNTCFRRSLGECQDNLLWHTDYYNPHPDKEMERYKSYPNFERINMVTRSNLFLSRLFITNAIKMNLAAQFSELKKIRVLDIGCGLSNSLSGLLAYLGEDRVEYLGIDVNDNYIQANHDAYAKFTHCKFIKEGALNFMSNPEQQGKYDLVLIQHPNFDDANKKIVFTKIFSLVEKVLAENGILYTTFSANEETAYFQKHVQDNLNSALGYCTLAPTFACNSENQLTNESGKRFIPENFVLISPPYQPHTMKLAM